MKFRTLGQSGLVVSEIGFGTGELGFRTDVDAEAAINAAFDAGVTLFDTADVYGEGRAETALGKALGSRRREVIVATKWGVPKNYPSAGVSLRSEALLIPALVLLYRFLEIIEPLCKPRKPRAEDPNQRAVVPQQAAQTQRNENEAQKFSHARNDSRRTAFGAQLLDLCNRAVFIRENPWQKHFELVPPP